MKKPATVSSTELFHNIAIDRRDADYNSSNPALPIDNRASSQRARMIKYMHTQPLDTLTARKELDVMHPAARIQELKAQGHKIDTVKIKRASECGKLHTVAMYVWRESGACHG